MTKTKTLFTAVSALAIFAAFPAYADQVKAGTNTSADASVQTEENDLGENVNQAWESTKKNVSQAAGTVSKEADEAYESVRSAFSDDGNAAANNNVMNIKIRNTADGMIGENIFNTQGERIGTINDIIVNSDGEAKLVVLGDGNFFGFGKTAAFDYNVITQRNADGDVITPLTEEMIDQATEFSYDAADAGDNITVMPANGFSVSKLLDANIVNPQNEEVAEVENISFQNGKADQLIITFNEVLGMGGDKAAMSYNEARLVTNGSDDYDFQLDANQAQQLKMFKDRN